MAFQPILDIETQTLLADFEPDLIKIDMALDITVVAEGIETNEERDALRDLGITLQQGYRFARPSFASVPTPLF
jgi:EAL domain-containing protein (putative c-di-GMP-specific phosphodiesterase class I)